MKIPISWLSEPVDCSRLVVLVHIILKSLGHIVLWLMSPEGNWAEGGSDLICEICMGQF